MSMNNDLINHVNQDQRDNSKDESTINLCNDSKVKIYDGNSINNTKDQTYNDSI